MMMRDGCLMKGISHDNISSVFATCFDPDHPPLLIYVDSNDSNLKKFLQQCKISDVSSRFSLGVYSCCIVFLNLYSATHSRAIQWCSDNISASLAVHSFIPDISIAPFQVDYYSEVLSTAALILCQS